MLYYSNMLGNVRVAAGYWDTWTQGEATQGSTPALLRVRLRAGEREISLWLNPRNLYVWGYSAELNGHNRTFAFDTHAVELQEQIRVTIRPQNANPFDGVSETVVGLGFDSNHGDIDRWAQRNRLGIPTQFWNVRGAIETLATRHPGSYRMDVARSLQQLIHFVSEGARFNDIEGVYRSGMRGNDVYLNGMHVDLTNQWGPLSSWMVGRHYGATNDFELRLGGTARRWITTIPQARQYVRMALGSAPRP